jgi:hypothetical protein
MAGKCPKCERYLTTVRGEEVEIELGRATWRGVAYSCYRCSAVLSVEADPMVLKSDLIDEVKRAVQVWSSR